MVPLWKHIQKMVPVGNIGIPFSNHFQSEATVIHRYAIFDSYRKRWKLLYAWSRTLGSRTLPKNAKARPHEGLFSKHYAKNLRGRWGLVLRRPLLIPIQKPKELSERVSGILGSRPPLFCHSARTYTKRFMPRHQAPCALSSWFCRVWTIDEDDLTSACRNKMDAVAELMCTSCTNVNFTHRRSKSFLRFNNCPNLVMMVPRWGQF